MNYAVVKNLANLLPAILPRFIKVCRPVEQYQKDWRVARVTSNQIPRLS